MITEILPTVFAIRWSSKWAGDVPGPRTVRAYLDLAFAQADPKLGKETYDGVSARTEGSYDLVELSPSKRLQTLHAQGARFGITGDNQAGAWFGETPVASAYEGDDHGFGEWNWKREEYIYIEALWAAKNPKGWAKIYA
ncbi:MAG: hypothetical protein H7343_03720 [Undibacterium sp.]|nr:hypothetical protein [Opitutaceae bacterium]